MVEAGKKVVDVPTHLADFGAALTSADSDQMQSVLACMDVSMLLATHVAYKIS